MALLPTAVLTNREILALVVDANNQSNDAGQFELRKVKDGSFAVVGVGVRDSLGQTAGQRPILDTPISLTSERRSARETIILICQKLSEQSKIPVVVNDVGDSLPGRETVAIGGHGSLRAHAALAHPGIDGRKLVLAPDLRLKQ